MQGGNARLRFANPRGLGYDRGMQTSPPTHGRAHPSAPSGLTHKLSAAEINALPLAAFDGPLHVVDVPARVAAAVGALRRETVLGFDTETRPAFRKGEHYPPALLQLAGAEAVWVFCLTPLGLPEEVAALLADPEIVKAGVSNTRDVAELGRLRAFPAAGFVDLGQLAKRAGLQHHGLRGLAAVLLGCRISKGAQMTNWARPDLPERALRYAATDAWIGRRLYLAMRDRGLIEGSPAPPTAGLRARLAAWWARARRRRG